VLFAVPNDSIMRCRFTQSCLLEVQVYRSDAGLPLNMLPVAEAEAEGVNMTQTCQIEYKTECQLESDLIDFGRHNDGDKTVGIEDA
jgi:hypothetical protein